MQQIPTELLAAADVFSHEVIQSRASLLTLSAPAHASFGAASSAMTAQK
jgi:hypothetical protein